MVGSKSLSKVTKKLKMASWESEINSCFGYKQWQTDNLIFKKKAYNISVHSSIVLTITLWKQ